MKYLIFGDVHGFPVLQLCSCIYSVRPDYIICTGDLDTPGSIRQLMDLQNAVRHIGIGSITVPGNHEACFVHNTPIISGAFVLNDTDFSSIRSSLIQDPIAYGFIEHLVMGPYYREMQIDPVNYGTSVNSLVIHGGLAGGLDDMPCNSELFLWNRLTTLEDYLENFFLMDALDIKIMFRGHDHVRRHVSYNAGELRLTDESVIDNISPTISLDRESSHIINPGALIDGYYALLETEKQHMLLHYLKVK